MDTQTIYLSFGSGPSKSVNARAHAGKETAELQLEYSSELTQRMLLNNLYNDEKLVAKFEWPNTHYAVGRLAKEHILDKRLMG